METFRRLRRKRCVIDDSGLWVRQTELVENLELEGFGYLDLVYGGSVHDGNANPLQVTQPAQGVERYLAVATHVG